MSKRPEGVIVSIPPLPSDISERLALEAKARGTTVEALALELIRGALRRADLALTDSPAPLSPS